MCGYLRVERIGRDPATEDALCKVSMVNREITPAFRVLVSKSVEREKNVRMELARHLVSADPNEIRDDIRFVLAGIRMDRRWSEDSRAAHDLYNNAITSALRVSLMPATEEVPKGLGTVDIFVPPSSKRPAVAIEIKTSGTKDPMALADEALMQMIDKGYTTEPLDGGVVWIALGIRVKEVCVRTENGYSD